ncbi:MAG: porin [Planctomycetaceae bacterium]|nr:porin [Planctomycetaceae bacterium]
MQKMSMKGWLLSAAALVSAATSASAQSPYVAQAEALFSNEPSPMIQQVGHHCQSGCSDTGCGTIECFDLSDMFEDSIVDIGGWVQAGYTSRSTGLFNTRPNRFEFNQTWIYAEIEADGSEGLDIGGRVDFLYGTDAGNTQAFGNEDPPGSWDYRNGWDRGVQDGSGYGFALPQLYATIAYHDLEVKLGHFYTLLGYEVVTAPDNFFYSHAFTMNNSEAFTHTGALATYTVNDDVTLYGGWTAGWDTGFAQNNGSSSFLGGASVALTDDFTVTYILTAGNLGFLGDGYTHSVVGDWQINDKLNYVIQSDLVSTNQGVWTNVNPNTTYSTIGINQYLLYSMTDELGVGARAEWWKADGESYYSITGGVNIRPIDCFVIRPEVRYQWGGGATNGVDLPVAEGAIFGCDAILTF